jgi:hypothetical protein
MGSRPAWLVLGAVAVTVAGWRIFLAGAEPGDAAPGGLKPAGYEALQGDLIKQNLNEAGDPILEEMFAGLNARHFRNALPAIPVRWEPGLSEVGARAVPPFDLQGTFGRIGRRSVILLVPSLQGDPAALRRVLSHEMVHAWLATNGRDLDSSAGHGPEFQAVLRRLLDEGAFEGVVADESERVSLRAWLDAESARLETESDLTRRLAAELEAERQADAYNQRAALVTDRIAAHRADVDHFNREVERYNLMLVYPDGLDAARLAPKPVR